MSFKVNNLTELRAVRDKAAAAGASDFIGLNHGNAWSVYFNDPEENRIEVYLDTPFHTPQPCGEPLNLEQSDDALLAEPKALVDGLAGSMARREYVEQMAGRLAGIPIRSEERRGGEGCVSTVRSRGVPDHKKKKQRQI